MIGTLRRVAHDLVEHDAAGARQVPGTYEVPGTFDLSAMQRLPARVAKSRYVVLRLKHNGQVQQFGPPFIGADVHGVAIGPRLAIYVLVGRARRRASVD